MLITILCGALALLCFYFCAQAVQNKGPLLDNSWQNATQKEQKKLDKSPLYRQSAFIYGGLGLLFALLALQFATHWGPIFFGVILVAALLLIYVVVSWMQSVGREQKKAKKGKKKRK